MKRKQYSPIRSSRIALLGKIVFVCMLVVMDRGSIAAQEPHPPDTEITDTLPHDPHVGNNAHSDSQASQDHTEHRDGLPQLDTASFPMQLFWLVLCFVALYLLLSRSALPRVADIIERRENRLLNDIDRTDELKNQAQQIEEEIDTLLSDARSKAQALLTQTTTEVKNQRDTRLQQSDHEIAQRVEQAEVTIQQAKHTALTEVDAMARDLTQVIVERLTDEKHDPAPRP